MTVSYLSITPHDPVIARDSRPFGAGIRMKSLEWPYPSVIAGSVRTALGKMPLGKMEPEFNTDTVEALKQVSVHGPLPSFEGHLYFPAPRDLLVKKIDEKKSESYPIRPVKLSEVEGCDLPSETLCPAMLPNRVDDEFKPAEMAAFWSKEKMIAWLLNAGNEDFEAPPLPKKNELNSSGMAFPQKESRFHVKIDPLRGSYVDGMFFESIGLDLSLKNQREGVHLAARIEVNNVDKTKIDFSSNIASFNTIATLGGERRISSFDIEDEEEEWKCPDALKSALAKSKKIRMVLATPALFSKGWLPGWLDEKTLIGCPPGATGLNLKLISACVERWKPLSGYSLEKGSEGPKPLRRLVPAGSVYFFKTSLGDGEKLADLWLRPVSGNFEDGQECRDGFGLALWGIWDYDNNEMANKRRDKF